MPKRSKKPADLNRLAAAIVGEATDDNRSEEPSKRGQQGGHARSASLSPEKRSEIAKKAARSRWERQAED
jgi:hypothetical protein